MLIDYKRKANLAAGVWLVSVAILAASMVSANGNIWDHGNLPVIAIMSVCGGAYWFAFWAYAKAKGHSGLLGVILPLFSVVGLVVLASLRDRHPETSDNSRPIVLKDGK